MNRKEYLIKAKIKRKTLTIQKLEVEIIRYAEILYNLPDDNEIEKNKIVASMRKHKARIELLNAEKQALIKCYVDY